MESVGLKLTPVLVRCFLDPLGLSVSIAGNLWTHGYSINSPNGLPILPPPTCQLPYTFHL